MGTNTQTMSRAAVMVEACVRGVARMIRTAITVEVFEAIAKTLPLGSVGYEAEPNERGERLIWLEDAMADRLGAMRGPGEDYSAVILQIAARERP
jgi:hypothetical protein